MQTQGLPQSRPKWSWSSTSLRCLLKELSVEKGCGTAPPPRSWIHPSAATLQIDRTYTGFSPQDSCADQANAPSNLRQKSHKNSRVVAQKNRRSREGGAAACESWPKPSGLGQGRYGGKISAAPDSLDRQIIPTEPKRAGGENVAAREQARSPSSESPWQRRHRRR